MTNSVFAFIVIVTIWYILKSLTRHLRGKGKKVWQI